MRVPSSPRVGSQPYRAPDVQAPGVTPMQDASGVQAARKGQALEGAGQSVMRVTEILQERVDETRSREAEAALADSVHELLNSPTGYRNLQGRAAIDGRESVLQSLQDTQQRIEKGLSPSQKALFQASATAYRQQALRTVDGHYNEQARAYELGETEALAKARLRDAAAAYFTPGGREPDGGEGPAVGPPTAFVTFGRNMLAEVERLAELRGLGPAQKAEMLDAAQDALHGEIVQGLVSRGRPDEATRYLGWAKVSSPDKRADLQRLVGTAAVKQQGRVLTENLLSAGGGLVDHLKALDAMDDLPVEVYDEAVQRLQARHTAMRTEAAAQRTAAWDAVEAFAQANGGVLDAEHQELLRKTGQETRYAAWKAQGGQRITDEIGHAVLTTKRAADLRREFQTLEELRGRYIDHLSRSHLETLSKRWESGDSDLPKEDRTIILADGLRDALGMSRQDELVDKDLFTRWENEVTKELRALMKSPKATGDEDALLHEAMRNAVKHGRVFLGDKATLGIAVRAEQMDDISVEMSDGRRVSPQIDRVHPRTGLRLGAMVDAAAEAQARRAEPNKPKGYVWSGGEAIPLERFGVRERSAEVVRIAEDLDLQKRNTGLGAVNDVYQNALLEAMRSAPAGTTGVQLRAQAAMQVLSRAEEWAPAGLTRSDVIESFKGDPDVLKQLQQAEEARKFEGVDPAGRPTRRLPARAPAEGPWSIPSWWRTP